jgi:pimeloyl-ACP methyl ester carboxylesterase
MAKFRWVVVLLLVALLVLQDRPDPTPPHQAEWLSAGSLGLRTVRAGQGDTTLFLLHGFGESLLAFRALFDQLATKYRVVAVDLPGFGVSEKPKGPYDHETMAATLWNFLDQHIHGDVVVVGHSLGGQLAVNLALDHPDRIVALVLIAPAGYGLSSWHSALTGRPARFLGWANVPIAYLLPIHAPDWLGEPEEWRDYDPLVDPAFRASATKVLREFDFAALGNRFREIRQPTLLIWGRLDPTIPFSTGQSIAALVPCNRFVGFDRTLHRPHQTEPDSVFRSIIGFLAHPPVCPPAQNP